VSTVLSIRISKDVKRRMDELRDVVDWNDEIKRFLEARVDELYRRKIIEEVRRVVELLPEMPRAV
jgi:predicted transcriptional regulator